MVTDRAKLEERDESHRRVISYGDTSDDDDAMSTPATAARASSARASGVLRGSGSAGRGTRQHASVVGLRGSDGGLSSDVSDVDDTPLGVASRGKSAAAGFRGNAHVAAAAAGVSPTPYGGGGKGGMMKGTAGAGSSLRAGRKPRPLTSGARSKPGGSLSATSSGWNASFDRAATRDMAARESALTFEVERLRVQVTSLAAENDAARAQMDAMRRAYSESEGSFVLQSHELDKLREKALGEGATRAAELEDQVDRQRRMLQELAIASEALAKDNVLLSSELVALRDRAEDAEERVGALSERLASAQRLYLAGQKSLERAEDTHGSTRDATWERRLEELLTPEVLTKSRPPSTFPVPDDCGGVVPRLEAPGGGRRNVADGQTRKGSVQECQTQRLRDQVTSLKRRLDKAERRVGDLEDEKNKMASNAAVARKAATAATNRQQQQLTGALRRLQWLVERTAQLEAEAAEKDDYVASLERRLLTQHKAMNGMASPRGGKGKATKAAWGAGVGGRAGVKIRHPRVGESAPATRSGGGEDAAATGWLNGADGRTPAAREALGLARRAMVEVEPGHSFRSTGSVRMSDDESEGESDAERGGGGGARESLDNRAARPGGGARLEMDIEISDDDSEDDVDTRAGGGRSAGGDATKRSARGADQPSRPTSWPTSRTGSPAALRESTSRVLDKILRFEPSARKHRSSSSRTMASPTVSTPGGGGEGVVGAPPAAPASDDQLSLEGIQDYIAQLQALHNKSEMLASSNADQR